MWFDAQGYVIRRDDKLISKYHKQFKKGILLDTTPLLVLFLGKYDKENKTKLLAHFNINEVGNTRKLNLNDFKLLAQFMTGLNHYDFFITPHIFTETIKHIWEKTSDKQFKTILSYFCVDYSFLQEFSIPYKDICRNEIFQNKKLEIGDISLIIENDRKSKTILSSDMKLNSIFDANEFLVIPLQFLTTLHYTIPNIN